MISYRVRLFFAEIVMNNTFKGVVVVVCCCSRQTTKRERNFLTKKKRVLEKFHTLYAVINFVCQRTLLYTRDDRLLLLLCDESGGDDDDDKKRRFQRTGARTKERGAPMRGVDVAFHARRIRRLQRKERNARPSAATRKKKNDDDDDDDDDDEIHVERRTPTK